VFLPVSVSSFVSIREVLPIGYPRTYIPTYRFRPTWSYVENWYGPQNPYIYRYNVEDCGNWYKSTRYTTTNPTMQSSRQKSGGGKIEVEMEIPPGEPPREVARRRRQQRWGGGSRWSRVRHGKNNDWNFGAGDDDAGASEHR